MCRRIVSVLCLLPEVGGKLYFAIVIQSDDISGIIDFISGGGVAPGIADPEKASPLSQVKIELPI